MGIDVIGWASSLLLVATIAHQVHKLWKEGSEGVSPWLFVGQMAASGGFVVYSAGTGSTVFIVTNSVLFLSAAAGIVATWRARSDDRRADLAPEVDAAPLQRRHAVAGVRGRRGTFSTLPRGTPPDALVAFRD